ncbi:MAG: hypothetical protein O8C67_06070 [Candidatus Methanoperedens sp.]|nr:hypothetical protein [Candidatus Methanoperedens sp.]
MAIQTMVIDPTGTSYTDDEIVAKINAASDNITRASSVDAAARPIGAGEVTSAKVAAGVAKANLDAMADTARGYIKTAPGVGEFPVISVDRNADGKVDVTYDDVPIE